MKKEDLTKIDHAITFKRRNSRPQKNLILNNQNKEPEKQTSQTNKNRHHYQSDDSKSDTNKSTKDKKSLPTLNPPSIGNPIRKIVAQKALFDYLLSRQITPSSLDNQAQTQPINNEERNNELTAQNMKLKTKIMNLEHQNLKHQRVLEDETQIKYPGAKDMKIKTSQQTIFSLKSMLKEVKKQANTLRQQNNKIKKTVKYTRVSELQVQRKSKDQSYLALQQEIMRITELLQQQILQNYNNKIRSNNNSELQQQCISLHHVNAGLKKQISQCSKKMKGLEERYKIKPEADKMNNKTVLDLKKIIKEKQIEIDNLKRAKQDNVLKDIKQDRGGVRSASLNKGKIVRLKCQQCNANKKQIKLLKTKIEELEQKLKQSRNTPGFEDITVKYPTKQQLESVSEFLKYRFKAHHLSYDNLEKYLIKSDSQTVSVGAMVQNLLAEPFFLIYPNYLENMIAYLFYEQGQAEIKVSESFEKSSSHVKTLFCNIIKPYDLTDPRKQQQIFIQIAQIVTNYCDHISAALDSKRNGQGTISQTALFQFLKHIELDEEYIRFIITQIVLQSTDLQHLNYYSLFQIFYLPNNNFENNMPQAVKQLDEEYEESQQSARIKGVQKDGMNMDDDHEYEQDFDLKQGVDEKIQDELDEEIPQVNEP